MLNNGLIIDILKFGLEKTLFKVEDLVAHLKAKGYDIGAHFHHTYVMERCLESFFEFRQHSSTYVFVPKTFVYLLQFEQLQESTRITEGIQQQIGLIKSQVDTARTEADEAKRSSATSIFYAKLALIATAIGLFISIGFSIWQISIAKEQTTLAKDANKYADSTLHSDIRLNNEAMDKIESLKDSTLNNKLDSIIYYQKKGIKKK